MLAGRPISASALRIASTAAPSEAPGARLNEIVAAGNWPRWLIDSGAVCSTTSAIADSGTCPLVGGRGRQVDRAERGQRLLRLGIGFEDHAVLVGLGEDRRDDALAERIVERVVDRRRGDAEPAGGGAVDQHIGRQPVIAVAGRDIARSAGTCCSRSISFGTQTANSSGLASCSENWYWPRLTVASIVRSCTGCM